MIPPSRAEIARFRAAFDAMPEAERPEIDADLMESILDAAGRFQAVAALWERLHEYAQPGGFCREYNRASRQHGTLASL